MCVVAKVGGVHALPCPVIDKLVEVYAPAPTAAEPCDEPGQLSGVAVDLVGLASCQHNETDHASGLLAARALLWGGLRVERTLSSSSSAL